MKNLKKIILILLCAVLIVAASVMVTLAYLTDTETVTNTFSVGSVGLTMDETDVKPDGTKDTDTRVTENTYHLLPGHTYIKDPVIHVDANSEAAYIFVKVENAIAAYEAATENEANGYKRIADQIAANGWTSLDGVENVFYKTYEKGQDDKDLEVFEKFKIDGLANTVDGWDDITPETTKVEVTGYAVQKDGFGSARAAWDAADFPEDADALVVTTTKEFTEAYEAGGSIKLGNNIEFSQTFNPATATSDVVLDLNGHTLSVLDSFYAYRKMTIMDSQGGGKIKTTNAICGNEITITGGTIKSTLANGSSGPGNYTITGGTFFGELNTNANFVITGGTFTFAGYTDSPEISVTKLYDSVPSTHQVIDNSDGSYTVTAK